MLNVWAPTIVMLLLTSAGAFAAEQAKRVSDLIQIPLPDAVNTVERFAPDGRPAIVMRAWRDNGNAHGYWLYTVLMKPATGEAVIEDEWNVVSIRSRNSRVSDFIRDDPHTFEDYVRSVAFARGTIDGRAAVLLLTATRQVKASLTDPSTVNYEVYKLMHRRDGDVGTVDAFELALNWKSTERYCNSELALSKEFGLPLPKDGPATDLPDGCP